MAFVRSITTTPPALASFQSNAPYPVSIAYTLAAPRRSRQSTNPPALEPRSAQTNPLTSIANSANAWSSLRPARETKGEGEADEDTSRILSEGEEDAWD